MYREFFGLNVPAFNNTPDPRFFFNTPDHEEALASMLYAAQERKGFVLVTGEVGSGKTLLSRLLLNQLGSDSCTAVINNTNLTGHELLLSVCREFDIDVEEDTTTVDLAHLLEEFLLRQYARDRLAVVVMDEAQNLPMESFEQLRMLGNLEADDAKLLQVLILGQPELQESFRSSSMRQLHQRIFRTFHLRALSGELTAGYVKHRLQIAGLPEGEEVFDAEALDAIFFHSEGIPRLINQICDNAMLAAYTESSKQVPVKMVNEVVEQMMSLTVPSKKPAERGAFAHQFLGGQAENREPKAENELDAHGEARRDDDTRDRLETRNQLDTSRLCGSGALDGNPAIERMMDRLGAMEHRLADLQHERRIAADTGGDVTTEVQMIHKLREQAVRTLEELTSTAREVGAGMGELIRKADLTSQRVEERARETLGGAEKQNAVLQAQAKHLLKEVHAYANGQQDRIADVMSQERAEFEAAHQMRRQAADMLKQVESVTKEANERLSKAVEEAGHATRRVEEQAAETLAETEQQNTTIRHRAKEILGELRRQNEAHIEQVTTTFEDQKVRFEAAQKHVDELAEQMKKRDEEADRRSGEMLDDVQSQIKKVNDQIEGMRESAKTRAGEINTSLDTFMQQTRGRFEQSHQQLIEVVGAARGEVEDARLALGSAREQILSAAEVSRSKADDILEQTNDLLVKTREQAHSLLTDLRVRITEQTEDVGKIWQTAASDGAKTLSELQAKLEDTRVLTDRSRAELESLVHKATQELAHTRDAFDASISSHKTEIATISTDAANAKADIAKHFDACRKDLEAVVEKHRQNLRQRVLKLVGNTDEHVSSAEARARKTIESLDAELEAASKTAERIYTDLQQSVATLESQAEACQARHIEETQHVHEGLTQLAESNRDLLDEAQGRVEAMTQRADEAAQQFTGRIDELRQTAKSEIAAVGEELDTCLKNTIESAGRVRSESETAASDLAGRMNQTQSQAQAAIVNAEKAIAAVRDQSKSSLADVRSGVAQMNKRASSLQRDLVGLGDEVNQTATSSLERLQQTAASVTEQIQSLRTAAQQDAEANHRRLVELRQHAEQSAEQIRRSASKLLDEVQEGAMSIREHANELLSQSQSGADKIGEQASNLLMQAHSSAERFREQAETLMQRAEANADAIRADVKTLRSDVLEDSEQIRTQVSAVKEEIVDAREESVDVLHEARQIQEATKTQANDLFERADEITQQTGVLLKMPKELIDEANQRAAALSEMSKKVSGVVTQLSSANTNAERNKDELDAANASASDKLELLKRHTTQVGQLVGIIRQLYGTMDTRIERLRSRLVQADDLCRSVPQEIEGMKQVLAEGIGGQESGIKDQGSSVSPPPKSTAPGEGSLGEVVQRSQKLNEWLRDVLKQETSKEKPGTKRNVARDTAKV